MKYMLIEVIERDISVPEFSILGKMPIVRCAKRSQRLRASR